MLAAGAGQAQPVETRSGAVEGEALDAVVRYLGIPYAAPPVGALRWKPPQDAQAWQGTLSATRARSACAQFGNFYVSADPATFDLPYGSEDCLYLNVWVPAAPAGPRPVLFFVHGGAGVAGMASYALYDAARLSRETGAVVVTTNYRLGLFGAIHLPALHSGDPLADSGSYFLLDLIKSLDWVQHNIAAFGGDPGRVTLAGQSAGAVSVFALARSPLAVGKFQRVISWSGLPFSASAAKAQLRSEAFVQRLMQQDGSIGDAAQAPAQMQRLGAAGLRDYLYGKTAAEIIEASKNEFWVPYLADGTVLPAVAHTNPDADEDVAQVLGHVPVMLGKTRNEASMLLLPRYTRLDQKGQWALFNGRSTASRSAFFDFFPFLSYRVIGFFAERGVGSRIDKVSDSLAARGSPVYRYEFDWAAMPQPWRGLFGAFHGLDLAFVFGNFITDTPDVAHFAWSADNAAGREALHRRMVAVLRGFLEAGDPNLYRPPSAPVWEPWGQGRRRDTYRWEDSPDKGG
ncbi:MAG: carboxylesterase/lipase family protein [Solimonas sp.]